MAAKKPILLFLALLFPVCIFLFLKFFGKNEFDVPALYQQEEPIVPAGCDYSYQIPYRIADSLKMSLSRSGIKQIYLVNFSSDKLVRVTEAYGGDISIIPGTGFSEVTRACAFLMPKESDIVLIDDQGKLRGQYESSDREEIDRLLLELDILLKKY